MNVDETDNVLWRAPASLNERITREAKLADCSKNAYITLAMTIFTYMLDAHDAKAKTTNEEVIGAMRYAAENGGIGIGCVRNETEWQSALEEFEALRRAGILKTLHHKKQSHDPAGHIYRFETSLRGLKLWNIVNSMLPTQQEQTEKPCSTT